MGFHPGGCPAQRASTNSSAAALPGAARFGQTPVRANALWRRPPWQARSDKWPPRGCSRHGKRSDNSPFGRTSSRVVRRGRRVRTNASLAAAPGAARVRRNACGAARPRRGERSDKSFRRSFARRGARSDKCLPLGDGCVREEDGLSILGIYAASVAVVQDARPRRERGREGDSARWLTDCALLHSGAHSVCELRTPGARRRRRRGIPLLQSDPRIGGDQTHAARRPQRPV